MVALNQAAAVHSNRLRSNGAVPLVGPCTLFAATCQSFTPPTDARARRELMANRQTRVLEGQAQRARPRRETEVLRSFAPPRALLVLIGARGTTMPA